MKAQCGRKRAKVCFAPQAVEGNGQAGEPTASSDAVSLQLVEILRSADEAGSL